MKNWVFSLNIALPIIIILRAVRKNSPIFFAFQQADWSLYRKGKLLNNKRGCIVQPLLLYLNKNAHPYGNAAFF